MVRSEVREGADQGGEGTWCSRMRRTVPGMGDALAGTLAWATAMGGSAATGLAIDQWATVSRIREVALLFALGGAVAFLPAFMLSRLISMGRKPEAAFGAAFVLFAILTVAATAAAYALLYRSYYSQWHEQPFSLIWFVQLVFTMLAALYQFAVLGLRLYFPFGFLALVALSILMARRAR